MMRHLLIAITAIATLSAGAAHADCDTRMQTVQTDYGDFFSTENPAYRQSEPILRDLRDAAMRLKAQGMEEACEEVVEAMEIAVQAFSEAEAVPRERVEATAEEIESRVVQIGGDEMNFDTGDLVGTNVYNYQMQFVGEVDGLLMSGGQPSHLMMGHGGFWNIGDAEVAVPLDQVRWDPSTETIFVPFTEEQIEAAPEYDREGGAWTADMNDAYYADLPE